MNLTHRDGTYIFTEEKTGKKFITTVVGGKPSTRFTSTQFTNKFIKSDPSSYHIDYVGPVDFLQDEIEHANAFRSKEYYNTYKPTKTEEIYPKTDKLPNLEKPIKARSPMRYPKVPIIQRNLKGKYIRKWPNLITVIETMRLSKRNLIKACYRNKPYKDFYWTFDL